MKKAIFERKQVTLEELKQTTMADKKEGFTGSPYEVIKEIELSAEDFIKFAGDLLEDQPWIERIDGGLNKNGEFRCIRVINKLTGERVLINNEGYNYARYTAIEL